MKKISNWVFGSFFRTLGRVLVYIILGYFISIIFSKYVKADNISFSSPEGYVISNGNSYLVWSPDSGINTSHSFNYNNGLGMRVMFSLSCLDNGTCQVGKYIKINYTVCVSPTSVGIFNGYSDSTNTTGNFTYIRSGTPRNDGLCTVGGSTGTLTTNYIVVAVNDYYEEDTYISGGSITFWNGGTNNLTGYATFNSIDLLLYDPTSVDEQIFIQNNQSISQNQTIIDQNNQIISGQDNINNTLTDDSAPTNLDSLSNAAGWLPAGPVDSILNLPLSFLTNLNTNLSKSCQSVNLPLPFIDKTLPLPCVSSLYAEIEGLPSWINTIGIIASAFMLFGYLINLYKYIDDTLTFRENNYIDNWSGV